MQTHYLSASNVWNCDRKNVGLLAEWEKLPNNRHDLITSLAINAMKKERRMRGTTNVVREIKNA